LGRKTGPTRQDFPVSQVQKPRWHRAGILFGRIAVRDGGPWPETDDRTARPQVCRYAEPEAAGPDDQPVLEDGKPLWDPVLEFRDRPTRDRFNDLVLSALRAEYPELLDEGDAS
jgi:hypothetical protein